VLGRYFPGYTIELPTLLGAIGVTLFLGLFAGAVPARLAAGIKTVEAMRPH